MLTSLLHLIISVKYTFATNIRIVSSMFAYGIVR